VSLGIWKAETEKLSRMHRETESQTDKRIESLTRRPQGSKLCLQMPGAFVEMDCGGSAKKMGAKGEQE